MKAKLTKAERSAIASAAQKKRRAKEKEKTDFPGMSGTPINKEPYRPGPSVTHAETFVADVKPEEGPFTITTDAPIAPYFPPSPPLPSPVQATPEKRPRAKRKPMPKAFAGAHGYAEKRLAEAIRERAECMGKLAMLNAEIPSLVQIIKALGNSQIPAEAMQVNIPPVPNGSSGAPLPAILIAQGGAIGFEVPEEPTEDQFLPKSGTMGGKWL